MAKEDTALVLESSGKVACNILCMLVRTQLIRRSLPLFLVSSPGRWWEMSLSCHQHCTEAHTACSPLFPNLLKGMLGDTEGNREVKSKHHGNVVKEPPGEAPRLKVTQGIR